MYHQNVKVTKMT